MDDGTASDIQRSLGKIEGALHPIETFVRDHPAQDDRMFAEIRSHISRYNQEAIARLSKVEEGVRLLAAQHDMIENVDARVGALEEIAARIDTRDQLQSVSSQAQGSTIRSHSEDIDDLKKRLNTYDSERRTALAVGEVNHKYLKVIVLVGFIILCRVFAPELLQVAQVIGTVFK